MQTHSESLEEEATHATDEARMLLRRQPTEPRATSYYLFHQYLESERFSGWTKFMPEWERRVG